MKIDSKIGETSSKVLPKINKGYVLYSKRLK